MSYEKSNELMIQSAGWHNNEKLNEMHSEAHPICKSLLFVLVNKRQCTHVVRESVYRDALGIVARLS